MNIDVNALRGGYSQEELEAAFKLVRPASHWKDPIDALIPADSDLKLIGFAVGYFTGSAAEISPAEDGKVRVEAEGYFNAIGA